MGGRLSDRLGRKPMWWTSLVGLFAVLGALCILQPSTISATFPAMFPTQVRLAGSAIAHNVSTALFGGTSIRGTGIPGVDTEPKPA